MRFGSLILHLSLLSLYFLHPFCPSLVSPSPSFFLHGLPGLSGPPFFLFHTLPTTLIVSHLLAVSPSPFLIVPLSQPWPAHPPDSPHYITAPFPSHDPPTNLHPFPSADRVETGNDRCFRGLIYLFTITSWVYSPDGSATNTFHWLSDFNVRFSW